MYNKVEKITVLATDVRSTNENSTRFRVGWWGRVLKEVILKLILKGSGGVCRR